MIYYIYFRKFVKEKCSIWALLIFQVMSESVGKVLLHYYEDAKETAKFLLFMDKFFDCANVRHKLEANQKVKPFCQPYTTIDDERFEVWYMRKVYRAHLLIILF